jgi:Na+/melibiose symporter-like transporter
MFLYLFCLAAFVRTVFTVFRIPSDAMVAELTSDYDERTSLMGFRYFFGWVGGVTLAYLVYKVFLVDTAEHPDGILNPEGWGRYGTAGAALIALGILVSSVGTHRLIPGMKSPPPKAPFSFSRTAEYLRVTLRNRSFLALFASALLFAVAAGVSMTLNIYFSRYYWALSQDQLWYFSPVNLCAAAAALYLAPRLTANHNKQTVATRLWVFAALFLPVPVILRLLGWFPAAGSDLLLDMLLVHSFIEICVIVIASILIASMMADLVEDSEKETGRRSEGLYFSALSFSAKATTGLGVVMAGAILEFVDFPVGAAFGEIPANTMETFGVIAVGAMVAFYLFATAALKFYRVTRVTHSENLAIIAAGEGTKSEQIRRIQ